MDVSAIGFRVVTKITRAPQGLVDAFRECATTNIADVVTKMFTMATAIKPLYTPVRRVAGSAVTVRVPPGDNLMVHVVLSHLAPGDLVVVDARGDLEYALGGALVCAIAKSHGAQAFVLDGVYRDVGELRSLDFPVFGRGLQPRPPGKVGPGEINTVISCGGVPVHPGDIVVADEDGVVVVPRAYAEGVLEQARERGRKDAKRWSDIAAWDRDHQVVFEKRLRETPSAVE